MRRQLDKLPTAAALAIIFGLLATLGTAPIDLKLPALAGLAGIFWLATHSRPGRAFFLGWLWAFAHFCSGIYWIYISTHTYGGAPAWLGLLLLTVLHGYEALYAGLSMAVLSWVVQRKPALLVLAAPAAFALAEWLSVQVMLAFPWLSEGYLALDTPLARLAPLIGLHGLVLVWATLAAAALALVLSRGRDVLAWSALAVIALLVVITPAALSWTKDSAAPLTTAIIQGQGEIRMNEKWKPANRALLVERFRDMTLQAQDAQLIVWPEGPLPATYEALRPYYLAELDSVLKPKGAVLFAGVLKETDDGKGVYNSVMLHGAGSGRYDKRHLVPFGEFFPIPDWLRPIMDVLDTPYSDFAFGAPKQPLLQAFGQPIFANICFEDVFADEFRRRAQGASLLVNLTNDSWFGAGLAPHQHLAISRMRALENGRWFIRSTNSGISALIAPDGRVAEQTTALYSVALLRGSVTPRSGVTPYQRFGDALAAGLAGLMLLISLLLALRAKTLQVA